MFQRIRLVQNPAGTMRFALRLTPEFTVASVYKVIQGMGKNVTRVNTTHSYYIATQRSHVIYT